MFFRKISYAGSSRIMVLNGFAQNSGKSLYPETLLASIFYLLTKES
jgi:hypothetical protein